MMNRGEAHFEVVLELRAQGASVNELTRWLEDNLSDTRDYEGCVSVQSLQDTDDSNRVVVIGQWASRLHWQRYIEWREKRGDLATVAGLVEGQPSFSCFDILGEWRNAT